MQIQGGYSHRFDCERINYEVKMLSKNTTKIRFDCNISAAADLCFNLFFGWDKEIIAS